MNEDSAPLRIAVAVVVSAGMALVGRRADDAAHAAGLAEFPGGKVEGDETAAEAAARECLEESGVEVIVGELLEIAPSAAGHRPIEVHFFLAQPIVPAATPRAPFAWTRIASLPELPFPAANAGVIARLTGSSHR